MQARAHHVERGPAKVGSAVVKERGSIDDLPILGSGVGCPP
jgi:hypothetical protein